jgi:hypothetical protein
LIILIILGEEHNFLGFVLPTLINSNETNLWETNCCSAIPQITSLSWYHEVHSSVHKALPEPTESSRHPHTLFLQGWISQEDSCFQDFRLNFCIHFSTFMLATYSANLIFFDLISLMWQDFQKISISSYSCI